ncbi:LIP-domain-containing protein [Xylariaceae sp. FL1272]|nr:LIP-domain-containing protein [Xylariaceae sp. FL1272]
MILSMKTINTGKGKAKFLDAALESGQINYIATRLQKLPNNSIPPSQDPWYAPPAGFEFASPGEILKLRKDPSNITAIVPAAAAYNILYRTTDTRYQPSWAVTTILVPENPECGGDGINVTLGTNSTSVDGSPSHILSTAFAVPTLGNPAFTDPIASLLERGWYVNIPDFEGPLASFLAGPGEGHAVLDSVRATLSSNQFPSGIENARYAMWGYSGGSFASTFAAERQSSYAPELNFAGLAIGGLLPNASVIFEDPTSAVAGLLPAAFLGVTSQYPEAREFLLSQIKTKGPYNTTGFLQALHLNVWEEFITYTGQDLEAYLINGLQAVINAPELTRVLGNNIYQGYHGIPQMPVFAYIAIGDEAGGIEAADAIITRYCGVGANILYHRNSIGGHTEELTNGAPRALDFLSEVFDGSFAVEHKTSGCEWVDVAVNVTSSASS